MVRSHWSRVGPRSTMSHVLIKRGNLDTDMHTGAVPGEAWSNAATAQSCHTRSPEGGPDHTPTQDLPLEGPRPCQHFASDGSLRNWATMSRCCSSHLVRGTSFWCHSKPRTQVKKQKPKKQEKRSPRFPSQEAAISLPSCGLREDAVFGPESQPRQPTPRWPHRPEPAMGSRMINTPSTQNHPLQRKGKDQLP